MKKNPCVFFVLSMLFSFSVKAQIITTIAGTGAFSYTGDGVPATTASLNYPRGVAADAAGNVYIADYSNARIRKVNTSGIISTIAGTGFFGFSGDGGPATDATLSNPSNVLVDAAGNVYFSDEGNYRVRKISTTGIITTIAGGAPGSSGDGGPATASGIATPEGIVFDGSGNLYIAEFTGHRVRKVNTSGIISTIVGDGYAGFTGDGGPATAARLSSPWGLATDAAGNLYICDGSNHRIRKISTSGTITTVAGTGVAAFGGDGGAASLAKLSYPTGIAIDAIGDIYIGEYGNHRVRKINALGVITTVAGTGATTFAGDGGPATVANLYNPSGVAFDGSGNLYITDYIFQRVRKVAACPLPVAGIVSGPTSVCIGSAITLSCSGTGGVWSSSATGVATVNSSGVVSGLALGTTIISYSATNTCGSAIDTQMVRVIGLLSGTIIGADTMCVPNTANFIQTTFAGTWSSSNPTVASIDVVGLVSAVSAGTTVISYTATNACGTASDTHPLFVKSASACASDVQTTNSEGATIEIVPNPSNGQFAINIPAIGKSALISLYDPMGRMVEQRIMQGNNAVEQYNISDLAKGTYYVRVLMDRSVYVQKVIIW